MAAHVLIVDDDPAECHHIETIVRNLGHSTETVSGGEAALARLARADQQPVSVVILDLVMPDIDGMTVLERLARQPSPVPVIVQAAPGGIDSGAAAMRAGALDFMVKPAVPERVRASLANALRVGALEGEILRMRRSRSGTLGLGDMLMHSPAMERVRLLAERAARSQIPVLLEGEQGVGKELLARAVHGSSARRSRPFVAVSCSEAPAGRVESLLFGDRPDGRIAGRILEASGGTLFLDEIGALSPRAQERLAQLLHAADSAETVRRPVHDIRLIATSSRRLVDLATEEGFREDLFYRLNVFPIWLPPLRERRTDIPDLARSFVARLAAEAGRSGVTGISVEATALLAAYDWPGNIRELERAVFRAVMLSTGGELAPTDFPQVAAGAGAPVRPSGAIVVPMAALAGVAHQRQARREGAGATAPRADINGAHRYGVARLLDERGELRSFEALEKEAIRFAIDHCHGRMSEVARRLGIGRSTLYRKIKDYGIAGGEAVSP